MLIIQFGLPSFKIASGHLAAPIGGSARVLQNFSTCPERQGCALRRRAHLRSPAFRPVRGLGDQAQQPRLIRAVGPPTARN